MLTIGHSTLALATFLSILRENGVRVLVDIRTIPKSRHNPQFVSETLSKALQESGIEYQWQRGLGGLRKPRKEMAGVVPLNAGWLNVSFRGYADYMQTPEFAAALDSQLARTDSSHTVLMCAEAVPWRCHRSLVADALIARGCPVEHILYDTNGVSHRQAHRLTSFAQVDGERVWYPAPDNLFQEDPGPLSKGNPR
jgi:uncharacterized protein (DUF488 family)